jgi:hypothetical protein
MKRRNFIQLTSALATLMPGSDLLTACKSASNNSFEEEIKNMAFAAFDRYAEIWNFNNFWKRGNTFDACLTFVDAVTQQWPDDPKVKEMQLKVKSMIEENLAYFNHYDTAEMWADDFGWWGLMGLNAHKFLIKTGETELADKFLTLSTDQCWEHMKKIAYDLTGTALPVPHGCRNGDAKGGSKGIKNTVTNALYFLLSTRIYRLCLTENINSNEKYLEMAYRQWVWFDEWFKLGQYHYLRRISDSAALVLERPMADFEGSDYREKNHPIWEEGCVWTGDQGMILAALTDMLAVRDILVQWIEKENIDPAFDPLVFESRILELIRLIGNGIKTALFFPADGIVREAPFLSTWGPEFGNDYLCGRGVLIRYLGCPNIQSKLKTDFSKNIQATAKAIWQTRDQANNQFKPEFTSTGNDELYIKEFIHAWGFGDNILKWDIGKMDMKQKDGVCQSIGLDALGAVIKLINQDKI